MPRSDGKCDDTYAHWQRAAGPAKWCVTGGWYGSNHLHVCGIHVRAYRNDRQRTIRPVAECREGK